MKSNKKSTLSIQRNLRQKLQERLCWEEQLYFDQCFLSLYHGHPFLTKFLVKILESCYCSSLFKVFIPETSSSTDIRVSSVHLPDSSSVAQSTSVSSVSTVTQSVLVSESAQVLVHSSAVSEGAMMVSDSTASTSSDLGSAIDKIIESTIGPDIMNGISTVTRLSILSSWGLMLCHCGMLTIT